MNPGPGYQELKQLKAEIEELRDMNKELKAKNSLLAKTIEEEIQRRSRLRGALRKALGGRYG